MIPRSYSTRTCTEWHWIKAEILERLRLNHCHNLIDLNVISFGKLLLDQPRFVVSLVEVLAKKLKLQEIDVKVISRRLR